MVYWPTSYWNAWHGLIFGRERMKQENRHFAVSFLFASLLHSLLFMALLWFILIPKPQERIKQPPIVYFVAPPSKPSVEPEKPQALAETDNNAPPSSPPEGDSHQEQAETLAEPLSAPAPSTPLPEPALLPATQTVAMPDPAPRLRPSPVADSPLDKKKMDPAKVKRLSTEQSTPALDLNPSLGNLSRWDRLRRLQALSNAPKEETLNLSTRQVRYASYFARLKERVENGWSYPAEAKREKLAGDASLIFTIQRDGQLLEVRIVKSSGAKILDASAVLAVQNAAPFAPFPKDWTLERLHIRATFEYIRRGGLVWRD